MISNITTTQELPTPAPVRAQRLVQPHYQRVWEWRVYQDDELAIAGGFAQTKRDAENDLNVWLRLNPPEKNVEATDIAWNDPDASLGLNDQDQRPPR